MTNAEYYSELASLRRSLSTMTLEQRTNLLRVYKTAADQAAEVLKSTLERGYSTLTSDRWRQIELQLRDGAQLIGDATDIAVKSSLTTALDKFTAIDQEYITSALERTGLTVSGLVSVYAGVNNKVITAVTTSVYNGVSYSERVWGGSGVAGDWLSKVKSLVTAGTAQGLDPVKIAKSLQEYVRGGVGTIGRWGKLVPGASDYVRRMGSAGVDYRALRIVRSELYRGIQSAQVEAGEINPACTGLYDWISHNGCPICDGLMEAGPYKKDDIPDYAHPNCFIAGTKILTQNGEKNIEDISVGEKVVTDNCAVHSVLATWKTKYSGEVIKITTPEGTITATPNHPFLINGNWITANDIKTGDYLTGVSISVPVRIPIKSKSDYFPSERFKKSSFFSVLSFLFCGTVPITAVNFNGKFFFFECKIDAILENSEIRNWMLILSKQSFIKKLFIFRTCESLIKQSSLAQFFIGSFSSSDCIVSGDSIRPKSVCIDSMRSFLLRRRSDSMLYKNASDCRSGNSDCISYPLDRKVLISEKVIYDRPINISFDTHNSAIVNVTREKVNTFVYNLSVNERNTYIANNFIVHNCSCSIVEHLYSRDEFMKMLQDYDTGADTDGARHISEWAGKYGLSVD